MSEVRAKGLALLASLLGDGYVEKRALTTNSFNRDLRELSEHCVGTVWTRPGLEPKTRSMLCIAMLTALGKSAELRLHVQGALNNGCSTDEIREVILQSVIYCGFPAAGEASRVAEEVFDERGIPR
jgi:4-carboxymuconolactone decarboxylase